MNKTDLINKLAERLEGDKKVAQAAVEGVIDLIQREVTRGQNVSISGFGVFEKRARAARTARNPRTGEAVKVKKTTVPAFRPGKLFRELVSGAVKLPKATTAPTSARATAAAAKAAAPRAAAAKAAPAAAKPAARAPRAAAAPKAAAPRAAAAKAAPKAAAAKAAPKAAATKAAPAKAPARRTAAKAK